MDLKTGSHTICRLKTLSEKFEQNIEQPRIHAYKYMCIFKF